MRQQRSRRTRIGAWRLLDLVTATMPFRGGIFTGGATLPEFGPPDAQPRKLDPDHELPGSNIDTGKQRRAVEQERARRFVRARRPSARDA
jgi:hypothetical protein